MSNILAIVLVEKNDSKIFQIYTTLVRIVEE